MNNGSEKKLKKKNVKKFLETNKDPDITYQNLWDTANVVLRGKLIVETRKTTDKWANYTPERSRKTTAKWPQKQ